jgi:hypothetical protein
VLGDAEKVKLEQGERMLTVRRALMIRCTFHAKTLENFLHFS